MSFIKVLSSLALVLGQTCGHNYYVSRESKDSPDHKENEDIVKRCKHFNPNPPNPL